MRVKILFISDKFKNSNYLDVLRETVPELKDENVHPFHIVSKKFPYLRSVVRMNEPHNIDHIKGFVNFTDLMNY